MSVGRIVLAAVLAAAIGVGAVLSPSRDASGDDLSSSRAPASHIAIPGWKHRLLSTGVHFYVCVADACGLGAEISFRKLIAPMKGPDDFVRRVRESAEVIKGDADGDISDYELGAPRFWRDGKFEGGEMERRVFQPPSPKTFRQGAWVHAYVNWADESYLVLSSTGRDPERARQNIRTALDAVKRLGQ